MARSTDSQVEVTCGVADGVVERVMGRAGMSAELCIVIITIVGLGTVKNGQSMLWTYGYTCRW